MDCVPDLASAHGCPPLQLQSSRINTTAGASEWRLQAQSPGPPYRGLCNSASKKHTATNWAATTGLLHCVVQQKMTSTYVSVIEIKHLNTQIAQEAGSKDLCTALQFPFWLVIHCTSKKINLARRRRTAPVRGQAAVEDRRAPFLHSLYLVWSLVTFDLTLPSL